MKSIPFKENARLGMEQLSKQPPVTLEEARAQALRVKIWSRDYPNKELDIKKHLKIYNSDWTDQQINDEYQRLIILYKC